MEDMMKMYASMGMSMGGDFPVEYTLVVNPQSVLVSKLISVNDTDSEKAELIAREIYKLAVLAQRRMSADELRSFLADSFKILELI